PGPVLVARVRAAGLAVVPLPGPSAVAAALSAAGLPADRYLFLGFLPRRGAERERLLGVAAESEWTVVLFESPPRLAALLDDLARVAGADRQAVVARELTKIHEEVVRGRTSELADRFAAARGECTVVIGPTAEAPAAADAQELLGDFKRAGARRGAAAAEVARLTGAPRGELYAAWDRLNGGAHETG
ncbi:MAG: 16S rRNA (cytidine(1402)-2'-O)-methyltransferase, partial [Dehalococcoidia bacterium]|nr:16S rRNA (cytidine(1402)-2'-O)-methyltransferase [Dehalococcoidia bacterium]